MSGAVMQCKIAAVITLDGGQGRSIELYDGDRLILEPIRTGKLLSVLRDLGPLKEPFPDIDDSMLPLDEPDL